MEVPEKKSLDCSEGIPPRGSVVKSVIRLLRKQVMARRPNSGNINFLEPENRYCLDQQAHSLTVKKKSTHIFYIFIWFM